MENFKIYDIPDFENEELQKLCEGLKSAFTAKQNAFAITCYYVAKIESYCADRTFKTFRNKIFYGYMNSVSLLETFGFNKVSISRLVNCYKCFCTGNLPDSVHLEMWASGFSPSKLFELLALGSKETILSYISRKEITPDMSVKTIRQKVKDILGNSASSKDEVINEEEIPVAYDPSQKYHMDYFVKQSRPALLNIIMTLQDAHQKLLNKKGRK